MAERILFFLLYFLISCDFINGSTFQSFFHSKDINFFYKSHISTKNKEIQHTHVFTSFHIQLLSKDWLTIMMINVKRHLLFNGASQLKEILLLFCASKGLMFRYLFNATFFLFLNVRIKILLVYDIEQNTEIFIM